MDFRLSDEQKALRQAARDFARAELPAIAIALERDNAPPPRDLILRYAELGFLGINVPESLGGLGLGSLDALVVLEEFAKISSAVAFPIWTFAVIAGAIWAEAAWGRYWGWDPKETTAFIAWVVYAGYLHARSTAGWRGRRAATVNVVGFAVMVFNLFFINLVVTGLHSYAGVG